MLGLLKNKENQPTNLPKNSENDSLLLGDVNALLKRIKVKSNVIECHLN